MRNIRVITDSACDLSTELVKKYGITVIPLNIHIGDETFVDRSMKNSEFYKKMSLSKELPKTSHPSTETFLENYEGDEDLIVITISSKLSGTYSAANLAKNMFEEEHKNKKIALIDTHTGSIAQGQLIIRAAQLIEEGKSFEEIVDKIENLKKECVFYGSLETLENAIKGGRINPLAGKIINALNFKIIIKIANHEVKPIDKARGENNSLKKVIEMVSNNIGESNKSLFIAHANCLDKAEKVKDMMIKNNSFETVNIVEMGAVMGTYAAQGAILISVL